MLGSVIVAIITVSLLLTGVYLGNNQDKTENVEEVESYNEGFFGSLDTFVSGLEKSAERGEEAKKDRYQEYLQVQQKAEETNARFQGEVKASQAESVPKPKVEIKTTAPVPATNTVPIPAPAPLPSGGEEILLDLGDFDDFDL